MADERLMYYGKEDVFAYRTYMKPLIGVTKIPESTFTGRTNIIFGLNVKIAVGGEQFLTSFTEGDNSLVVATDSMKNFIQRHLAIYDGATAEGFIAYASKAFLEKYEHVDRVEMTAEEVPFEQVHVPGNSELVPSNLVFKHSRNERSTCTIEYVRKDGEIEVKGQSSAILDLQLIKVKGNSFVGYIRDEYTTLPEDSNRPLFIYLNIYWEYEDWSHAYGDKPGLYVASEQVKDLAAHVFHQYDSPSIQSLIYKIGCRILERFPQLKAVTFQSQNRTWETVVEDIPESEGKVYTEPRPPYGFQVFSVTKKDVEKQNMLKKQ